LYRAEYIDQRRPFFKGSVPNEAVILARKPRMMLMLTHVDEMSTFRRSMFGH